MNTSAPAGTLAAAPLGLSTLWEGQSATVDFTVTDADMRNFADISGDRNPLHVDDTFARSKGFDGAVVYGALLVAKISQLIGMKLPGRDSVWTNLSVEFRKPLFVNQPAQVEGVIANLSASTGMIELKLTVRTEGKLLAKGRAEILIVEP
jgi:3-hydroxybutyryl-CoA dehydratase